MYKTTVGRRDKPELTTVRKRPYPVTAEQERVPGKLWKWQQTQAQTLAFIVPTAAGGLAGGRAGWLAGWPRPLGPSGALARSLSRRPGLKIVRTNESDINRVRRNPNL
ncbi:hypothetical protein MPTK1_5g15890 [Marchantia polymorpha subsp. ruderalis]|uniref:Uncharacterized protein n=2 Tax=Marchantia polymorpha TaxID=3197 RepID=A0AAF6BIT3_MARPO|nr:hypothetical protein MARPO_0071s0021 [Marchantia polymorpha]BBN11917.1 hypothetical protein Mp_5g15890 [Marchantia polymorpha subsp. ruderalis]|eukprot:PTQ35403.1 hypothetical protein MARPO_0071s0021 [Marchantia polymorpha]